MSSLEKIQELSNPGLKHIQLLSGAVIYKTNIMFYLLRPKASDTANKLIKNVFAGLVDQVGSGEVFS